MQNNEITVNLLPTCGFFSCFIQAGRHVSPFQSVVIVYMLLVSNTHTFRCNPTYSGLIVCTNTVFLS